MLKLLHGNFNKNVMISSILHTITNCLGPFQLSKEALNLLHFTTCMSNAYTYYNKPTISCYFPLVYNSLGSY